MSELPKEPLEEPPSPPERPSDGAAPKETLLGRLVNSFYERMFAPIDYPTEHAEKLQTLSETHTLIYLSRTRSLWLALYLNFMFKKLSIPTTTFVGSVSFLLSNPIKLLRKLWRRTSAPPPGPWIQKYTDAEPGSKETQIANLAYRGSSVFFTLTAPRSVGRRPTPTPKNDFIRALLAVAQVTDKPLCIIPHILTDRTLSGTGNQTLADRIFGDKRRPGRLRGMLIRVRTYRTAIIRIGEPLFIDDVITENPEANDATLVKKIRHTLNRTITEEERVIAGPDLPSLFTQERHVLRNPLVRDAITEVQEETGQSAPELEHKASKQLREIAAKFDVKYIKFLDGILNMVFNRIYDGIVCDQEGLKQVLEASRKGPIVFCPCHRSHVDYLVLSHLLWRTGLTPPHIAAGVNLSFFPLGPMFRGSGAFFLRRSFKGDKLYSAVFRSYVMELIGAGTSIEFFLEGTRSRTGKLLTPKFGFLGMVVEAWRRQVRDDVLFVPVSIDYEKLIEAKSYERELSGAKKKKEDITALLKTTSVLRSKFGRMHVQFGTPISIKEFAAQQELPQSMEPEHEESWRDNTTRLAYHILHGISLACTVSPTAVVATVLLGHPGRGLSRSLIVERSNEVLNYLDGAAARFSEALLDKSNQSMVTEEALDKLVDDGTVLAEKTGRGDTDPIYHIPENKRLLLDFHKNSLINHFAPGALLSRVLIRQNVEVLNYEEVRKETRFLSRLFKREFSYRVGSVFASVFDEILATLAVRGFLDAHEDGTIGIKNRENLEMLGGFLDSFVEAYWITALSIRELRTFPLWQKELITHTQEQARRAYLEGKISRPEAVNSTLIMSALRWFQDSGVLVSQTTGKKTTLSLTPAYAGDALEELITSIERYV